MQIILFEELHSPTGKTYLEISQPEGEQWLHVDWLGYPTAANVSTGGIAYLDWLRKLKLHGVLNNNRHLVGRWDSSPDWLQNTWLPYTLQSGLRYWACLGTAHS